MTAPKRQDEGAPPLWRQLRAAATVLQAVTAGQSATAALAAVGAPLRPAAQALAFHGLRQRGRALALRAQLAKRPPPPATDALLCLALALAWDPAEAPYEVFTLVDQAVEAVRHGGGRGDAGFVNACLRRFLREREALVAATDADPQATWNHPRWWIDRLRSDWPDRWQDLLRAANAPPPLTLRVNRRRTSVPAVLQRLQALAIPAWPIGDDGVWLPRGRPVHELPGFEAGDMSVQDAAAQLAAPLLLDGGRWRPADAAGRPLRVLDACAAPGGKTAHLLELADAEVTALDVDPVRCERIGQTLGRLGLQARVLAADAAQVAQWWDGLLFDAVLLDAPCSASGIVRRHPDVRWLRRPGDIAHLAATQATLLEALWPLVAPGGRLLFCTCSVFRAEGQEPVQAFLARHTEARLLPSPGHLPPRNGVAATAVPDNPPCDNDGFFYALLEKLRA